MKRLKPSKFLDLLLHRQLIKDQEIPMNEGLQLASKEIGLRLD